MNPIRALVALEKGIGSAAVEEALPQAGEIEVLEWIEGIAPGSKTAQESGADLVIVACAAESSGAISLIESAVADHADRPVVVLQLGSPESNGFMQEVFAAGADDIIALPETPERIRHALQKAIARKRGAALAKGAPARLICVLGPKGGTGKTVTACNLAVALAEQGHRVGLVDLDLHFGDVGLGLRLTPERTIYDLARAGGTLDAEKLEDYLVTHVSGARALLAPVRPDHAGAVSASFISEVLALLRSTSDVVVVDTSAGFGSEVIASIDSSTDVCVVGMLDAFSLKDTKLGLETLDRMGYDRGSIRLVLNRADSSVGISQEDVRSILGRDPDVLVPSQRDIPRTVTEGIPIVTSQPKSIAAKAFRTLASFYLTTPAPAAEIKPQASSEPRRRSLLRRA
jgi:Flp pilus assembly CpaE family ATPase